MGTLSNSVDQDKMQHETAFHQGLHCLLKNKINLQGLMYILAKSTGLCLSKCFKLKQKKYCRKC